MTLKFLLDEHLRGPLWHAIVQHNLRGGDPLDAVRVGDSPDLPLSADDPAILLWAEREGRILVTEDRHTMPSHLRSHLAQGHRSPGIFIIRANQPMRTLIECLLIVSQVGVSEDFADAFTYIP